MKELCFVSKKEVVREQVLNILFPVQVIHTGGLWWYKHPGNPRTEEPFELASLLDNIEPSQEIRYQT